MVSNPCLASPPGPREAKSPAQRHPHEQTGKPRRTGLPHPPPASLLPGPVPWGWHLVGSPQSFMLGLQEGTQACDLEEFLASTTSGGQGKSLSYPILKTDRQKEVRTGLVVTWIKLYSGLISLCLQICSNIHPHSPRPSLKLHLTTS